MYVGFFSDGAWNIYLIFSLVKKFFLFITSICLVASCGDTGAKNVSMPGRKIESSSNLSNHISDMKVFMGNENAANGMRGFSALVENENQLEFIYTSDEDQALNVIRSS